MDASSKYAHYPKNRGYDRQKAENIKEKLEEKEKNIGLTDLEKEMKDFITDLLGDH